jgi:hypothetical protein
MDRNEIHKWLKTPTKSWRWNEQETDRYSSLECDGSQFIYTTWSHDMENGGQSLLGRQSIESFECDGPSHQVPQNVQASVQSWLTEHGLSSTPRPR